jgi:hypothetical protein
VKGTFDPPAGLPAADLQPFEVVLTVVNGAKPVPQEGGRAELVLPSRQFAAPLRLAAAVRVAPGDNRLDVLVRNAWDKAPVVERHVFFRRPPRVVSVAAKAPGEAPFTDVEAEVESASELTRVEVNGREYPVAAVAKRVRDGEIPTWRVLVPQVSLTPGDNAIRLTVSNQDGPALAEGRTQVAYAPPKPKVAPQVQLTNRPAGAVREPKFTARFVVRSTDGEIRRVELRRGSEVLAHVEKPEQTKDSRGVFEAAGELGPVPLKDGANSFQVVAVNDGGPAQEALTVSHVPVPEWLEIDPPTSPLPRAEFTMTGRVTWTQSTDAAKVKRKLQRLRIFVNKSFQQQPPVFRPAGPNRLEFSARVVLNKRSKNLVEVVCPDLHVEAGGRQEFTVDCAEPQVDPRTLHLLIVSVDGGRGGLSDRDLAARALKALGASADGEHGLRSPVFRQVVMHPYAKDRPTQVLSGYVTPRHVRGAVKSIREHSGPNDVVLIYWLGREAAAQGEPYLLTSDSRPGRPLPQTAIPARELLNLPGDMPGACALLLDVAAGGAPPTGESAATLADSRAAVLRYAWSKTESPVEGLLMTLEDASARREAISLLDLAVAADRARGNYPGEPTLIQNLRGLPALADVVISRKP